MIHANGNGRGGTLYEQVLEFAHGEIDDASSKIAELRRSLHLLEARVEAAKSVYESVAARLNLEDEQEDSAAYAYDVSPPPQVPEPPTASPAETAPAAAPPSVPQPAPPAPAVPFAPPAPEPGLQSEPPAPAVPFVPPPAPEPQPEASAPVAQPPGPGLPEERPADETPAPSSNGASEGFSVDLIKRHLEQRAQRASVSEQAPRPAPPPPTPAPEAASKPDPESEPKSESGGFPGLSEADRALIGEYLRSKREG